MHHEELYLQDIIEASDAIEHFLKNIDETEFMKSELLQSAVLHKFTIIGEAAARVSEELRKHHSEVEWKTIIGFRNIVVHAYFSIKWEIVWETAKTDIASLREQISEILQNDFPDFKLREEN